MIDDQDDVAMAVISVAELLVGVRLASGTKKARRQAYVDAALETIPVIPSNTQVAREQAGLLVSVRQAGKPRGVHDLVTAATTRASDRILVTADASALRDLPGIEIRTHQ